MSVVVDQVTMSEVGSELIRVARALPERPRVPGGSAGDQQVDEAVHDFLTSIGHCVVGAATTVYTLGQDVQTTAAAFAQADRLEELA